jgi:iron complex outermembrane receptor protein
LANIFFQKNEGVPGLGSRKSLNARLTTWRDLVSFVVNKRQFLFSNLDLHLDIFFDYLNSQFVDRLAEISLTPQDTDDKTYRFGSNLRLSSRLGSHQNIRFFIAQRSEYYRPLDHLGPPQAGQKSSRQNISIGIEDEILLLSDRLSLVPSVRLENLYNSGDLPTDSDHQLSAKLGLSVRAVSELYFKANVYRGFRNPTFSELFGDRGALQGNPGLLAEKGFNFDVGFAYDVPPSSWLDGAHLEATYFRHDVNRLIQFVQTSTFTAMAMNMNQALLQGAEVMAWAKFNKRFRFTASYTYQRAKDTSNNPDTGGKFLPGRPVHELYALLGWEEKWQPWFKSGVYTDLRYMSDNFLDMQNLLKVTDRAILGAGVSLTFIDKLSASFSVQNILNDRISDLIGYPLPGRSYWGNVNIRI